MAHECHNCGMVCHCNGDIDDLVFSEGAEADRCMCCDEDDRDDDEYYAEEEIEKREDRDRRALNP